LTIEDGKAYTQSSKNNLYEIDTLTGAILSVKSIPTMQTMTSTGNGSLFGVTYNSVTGKNEIYSIDTTTGFTTLLNSFAFDSGSWNAELIRSNDRVFAQSSSGTIYEFNVSTGAIVSTTAGIPGMSLLANDAGSLVGISYNNTTSKNELYSIDRVSGATSLLNSFDLDSGYRVRFYQDGSVYVASTAGTLYEFDFLTGVSRSVTYGLPQLHASDYSYKSQQPVPEPSTIAILLQGSVLIMLRKKWVDRNFCG
jgi:outer membrane protein assembly factor BamB